jgi:U3 small nucleolar RNA-associated protein 3
MHLSTSDEYAQQPELLRAHPVYSRLLVLKKSLPSLDDVNTEEEKSDIENEEDQGARRRHEDDTPIDSHIKRTKNSEREQPPKKKRKITTKSEKPSLPVFDLVEPVFTTAKPSRTRPDPTVTDPYGETTSLQHADVIDKSARRKTLRFHTSKIESASAKRRGARINAVGGDDDLPYRERRKERTNEAKSSSARGRGGEDLDDPEFDVGEGNSGIDDDDGESGNEEDGPGGYYELVKRQAKEKKQKKKAEYEAAHSARYVFARIFFFFTLTYALFSRRHDMGDDEDMTGPRAITRTILANKGLTPRRAKSVRNPRVKKRQKFEKAKKKISSQKAIYKGGVGSTGRYHGEKSGISKVVKSVRFA